MIELKMYGQHTSTYEYVKMMIRRLAEKANLKLHITEVDDWTEIVKQKVPSLPTITVNNHINMSYNDSQNINEFVQELATKILKEENYGAMLKMIVPTDFSDTATNALVYAHGLSKPMNGVIKLLHVYHPTVTQVDSVVIVDEEVEKIRRKQLDDFVNKINHSWIAASSDFVPIDSEFRLGFVVDEIEKICKDADEDSMVIIGSTGSSGTLKRIFGSVSTQLAKSCKRPLLIVPPKATFEKVSDILYAIDDFDIDEKAYMRLLKFANTFKANVHFVHIKNDEDQYPIDKLKNLCREAFPKLRINAEIIDDDDVVEAINNYALEHTVDIISMSTSDRGFIKDLFHKSVSRRLAINSRIPLLVFHV